MWPFLWVKVSNDVPKPLWPMNSRAVRDIHESISIFETRVRRCTCPSLSDAYLCFALSRYSLDRFPKLTVLTCKPAERMQIDTLYGLSHRRSALHGISCRPSLCSPLLKFVCKKHNAPIPRKCLTENAGARAFLCLRWRWPCTDNKPSPKTKFATLKKGPG